MTEAAERRSPYCAAKAAEPARARGAQHTPCGPVKRARALAEGIQVGHSTRRSPPHARVSGSRTKSLHKTFSPRFPYL
eukprot:1647263-Prymnesium_polylepis.1